MNNTEVIVALIGFCTTVITAFLVPWIKAKTDSKKFENLRTLINGYVDAAEQLLGAGTGQKKKELVVSWLTKNGITVDNNVNAIIEAAVYSLNKIIDEVTTKSE